MEHLSKHQWSETCLKGSMDQQHEGAGQMITSHTFIYLHLRRTGSPIPGTFKNGPYQQSPLKLQLKLLFLLYFGSNRPSDKLSFARVTHCSVYWVSDQMDHQDNGQSPFTVSTLVFVITGCRTNGLVLLLGLRKWAMETRDSLLSNNSNYLCYCILEATVFITSDKLSFAQMTYFSIY